MLCTEAASSHHITRIIKPERWIDLLCGQVSIYDQAKRLATENGLAGVTLECLPHEKSTRGEIITNLICLSFIKISPAP